MNKISVSPNIKTLIIITLLVALFSCTATGNKTAKTTTWDFDHHLQYTQTTLTPKTFLLVIETQQNLPKTKTIQSNNSKGTAFERGSAFLIRKSLAICKGYNYSLELIDGIEGVNDKQERPNLRFGALTARLTCS